MLGVLDEIGADEVIISREQRPGEGELLASKIEKKLKTKTHQQRYAKTNKQINADQVIISRKERPREGELLASKIPNKKAKQTSSQTKICDKQANILVLMK